MSNIAYNATPTRCECGAICLASIRFCKPWLTLGTELFMYRWCLCKEGYVRNAWGDCISIRECMSCANERHADFNACSTACPLVCGKPEPQSCTRQCEAGCACAPGYILDPWGKMPCIPAATCPPKCPRYSSFQLCTSNCEPNSRVSSEFTFKMSVKAIVLACVSVLAITEQVYGENRTCGDLEVYVTDGRLRYDHFCKPWTTLKWHLRRPRWCLCKHGYVRNAWGRCITVADCHKCRHHPHTDFDPCSSACPAYCDKPLPKRCTRNCVSGCACAPGFVRHPYVPWVECVPVTSCAPRCPLHSTFHVCTSNCEPHCHAPRPSTVGPDFAAGTRGP
ncbi:hypothetical protein MTO96_026006 [Rhipicephalus appendiculatus]